MMREEMNLFMFFKCHIITSEINRDKHAAWLFKREKKKRGMDIFTRTFALMQSPTFWSIEPTTLRHLLAIAILAVDRPVNLAISSSAGNLPWLLLRVFRALCIWFITLHIVNCMNTLKRKRDKSCYTEMKLKEDK